MCTCTCTSTCTWTVGDLIGLRAYPHTATSLSSLLHRSFLEQYRHAALLNAQDDLAEILVLGDELVSAGRVGERQHLIDDRADGGGLEEWQDVAREGLRGRDLFGKRARAQHGADEGRALAQQEPHVELVSRAGDEADEQDSSLHCERTQVAGQVVAADEVEDAIDAAAAGKVEDGVGEIGVTGADGHV